MKLNLTPTKMSPWVKYIDVGNIYWDEKEIESCEKRLVEGRHGNRSPRWWKNRIIQKQLEIEFSTMILEEMTEKKLVKILRDELTRRRIEFFIERGRRDLVYVPKRWLEKYPPMADMNVVTMPGFTLEEKCETLSSNNPDWDFRVEICEHTGEPVLQMQEDDGNWLCMHEES